jgi:hypothetical protein
MKADKKLARPWRRVGVATAAVLLIAASTGGPAGAYVGDDLAAPSWHQVDDKGKGGGSGSGSSGSTTTSSSGNSGSGSGNTKSGTTTTSGTSGSTSGTSTTSGSAAPKPTEAPKPTKAPEPTQAPKPTEAPKPAQQRQTAPRVAPTPVPVAPAAPARQVEAEAATSGPVEPVRFPATATVAIGPTAAAVPTMALEPLVVAEPLPPDGVVGNGAEIWTDESIAQGLGVGSRKSAVGTTEQSGAGSVVPTAPQEAASAAEAGNEQTPSAQFEQVEPSTMADQQPAMDARPVDGWLGRTGLEPGTLEAVLGTQTSRNVNVLARSLVSTSRQTELGIVAAGLAGLGLVGLVVRRVARS